MSRGRTEEVDYRRLVEEAAVGLERPARYQGFEPPDRAGDCRIEVLVSEVPHELILSPDLVVRQTREVPGTGEAPAAPVFIDGKKVATLRGADVADQFKLMVADYIEGKFGQGTRQAETTAAE